MEEDRDSCETKSSPSPPDQMVPMEEAVEVKSETRLVVKSKPPRKSCSDHMVMVKDAVEVKSEARLSKQATPSKLSARVSQLEVVPEDPSDA